MITQQNQTLRDFQSFSLTIPSLHRAVFRITSLALDLQRTHKADEMNKDVSKMKNLLKILQNRPPLRKIHTACVDREPASSGAKGDCPQ